MLIKLSYWAFARKRSIHFVILPCFADLFSLCHTERSEVSINLKCEFALLKRILNSLDFSLSLKMTNVWEFCLLQRLKTTMRSFCFVLTLCARNDKGAPSLRNSKVCFLSVIASRFFKNGVAIYKFKRKFTFGLPRICTVTLCKFSQWRIPCHTEPLEKYLWI